MNLKILSVEDDKQSAKLVKEILGPYFEVEVAYSGEEALEIIDRFIPDIVLLDRKLPGMSGDDFGKAILSREDLRHVKIVMVSSLSTQEDIKKGFFAGADYYLPKPFDHDQLLSLIERIINARINQNVKERYL